MAETYAPDRWVWTDTDFDGMGWHDCRIHALTSCPDAFELVLDLDHIFQWVPPAPGERHYCFWVSPATLVFENVYELELDSYLLAFEIDAIQRGQARPPKNGEHIGRGQEWRWEIGCHDGQLELWSVGYRQYVRAAPVLSRTQALGLDARGGISFVRGRTDVL